MVFDDGHRLYKYKRYRRLGVAELVDWSPGADLEGVSISVEDAAAGSPRAGDKIARNPDNHADRWLVAAAYFVANFEPAENEPFRGSADADERRA